MGRQDGSQREAEIPSSQYARNILTMQIVFSGKKNRQYLSLG